MAVVTTKPITAAEFYEFVHRPENRNRRFDLVRGEIVDMSGPGKKHGFVCGNAVALLWLYAANRKKGYVCSNDTGVIVERDPDSVRGPDIQFFDDVARDKEVPVKWATTPARLAIEVLSPNDSADEVMERAVDRLNFGAEMVWVIDPEAESVAVYGRGKQPLVIKRGGDLTGDDVLPGFRCAVTDFFKLPGQ